MILHHVAQCAGRLHNNRPEFHSECFRGCDLHMIDVVRVPERLENRVRKSQDEDVLRGFFSEKMVNAVSLTLL